MFGLLAILLRATNSLTGLHMDTLGARCSAPGAQPSHRGHSAKSWGESLLSLVQPNLSGRLPAFVLLKAPKVILMISRGREPPPKHQPQVCGLAGRSCGHGDRGSERTLSLEDLGIRSWASGSWCLQDSPPSTRGERASAVNEKKGNVGQIFPLPPLKSGLVVRSRQHSRCSCNQLVHLSPTAK